MHDAMTMCDRGVHEVAETKRWRQLLEKVDSERLERRDAAADEELLLGLLAIAGRETGPLSGPQSRIGTQTRTQSQSAHPVAQLESRRAGNGPEGSNPSPSA
jgi:hypothetical protein